MKQTCFEFTKKINNKTIVILLIFFVLLSLRIININADPPSNLSSSAGIWLDEMHNVHQVRNKILFGSWKMDRYPSISYSPIFSGLQYVILLIVGVGLWQIKVLPVILSIFSLFLAYKALEEYYGFRYGLVALILLGFNYTFIMYNRLGLYENLVLFFMLLTLYFWQKSVRKEKAIYFAITGLSAGFAFLAKSLAFYFVGASALAMLFYFFQKGLVKSWKHGLSALSGAATAGVIWYLGFYLPFKEDFTCLGSSWFKLAFGSGIWKAVISENPLLPLFIRFQFLPLTLWLAIIFTLFLFHRFSANPQKSDPVEIFIAFWFLSGLLFLGLLSYNPTRYYLPILPSVVLLATLGLMKFGYVKKLDWVNLLTFRSYLISFFGILGVSFYFLFPYMRKIHPIMANVYFVSELSRMDDFLLSVCLGLLFILLVRVLKRKTLRPANVNMMFSLFFVLITIFCFLKFHPFNAKVQIKLDSNVKSVLKVYWSNNQKKYNKKSSNSVHTETGSALYTLDIGNLNEIENVRINPLSEKGIAVVERLEITQPGFEPIIFETKKQFENFFPVKQIGQMTLSGDGMQITSGGSGREIDVHTTIKPAFKAILFFKYLFKVVLYSFIITVMTYFLWRIVNVMTQKPGNTFSLYNGDNRKRRIVQFTVVLIVCMNFFHYMKWVFRADFSILNASVQIGKMLPPNSLIAGQGVMAATIQNKIRHIQAPNWFEDNKNLFRNYPITHLFLSHYGQHLDWYRRHYPEIMKQVNLIGAYHISNNTYYLLEIHRGSGKVFESRFTPQ